VIDVKKIKELLNIIENKLKKPLHYIIYFVYIIVIFVLALIFTLKKVDNKVLESISYVENSVVDYKVYYLDNPFYTEKYLSAGKTYIAQYVNYIDIDFNYLVNYVDKLSGDYEYYVKANLVAYTPGDENDDLWTKEYILSNSEKSEFNNTNNYNINKNIIINYQDYLSEYNKYRSSSAVASSCHLIIDFIVYNKGEYTGIDDIEFNRTIKVDIPISDPTFKVTYSDNLSGEMQTISKIDTSNITKTIFTVIAIILWIIELVLVLIFIYVYINYRKRINLYDKKLKKILTTYDGIIVNVEKLPDLTNTNIVYVTTFDELVDAQNEVRLPINFKEYKGKRFAKFVLLQNNLAWIYCLKEEDLSEKE
jgi:hypothetical protein